ncbi:MAG: hypothetical protein NVS9B4_06310 [Candidatus Acidiferrum sp.]
MMFLTRIVWLMLGAWFVFRVIGLLFGGLLRSFGGSIRTARPADPGGAAANPERRLVRDPICGMHLAEVLAIPLRDGGELVHFCSAACRDKYAASMSKIAANG